MITLITKETINEMESIYDRIHKNNGSFYDLQIAMSPFNKLSIFTNYYFAKYLFTSDNITDACKYITDSLRELECDDIKSQILTLPVRYALKNVYGLAGEIFANSGKFEQALYCFQDYQLCISRIESIRFEDSFLSFRNYNEHTLSDLINNEITVCSPRVMNDPYDTLLLKWGEYIRTKMADKKHINPFCDAFHSYRIRAFAKVIGQSGKEMISNTLMWSHYAGNHTGFCVRYRFSNDFMSTTEDRRTVRFKNIIYHPTIKPLDITQESINTDKCLCTKQENWSYESEVRMIAYEPDIEGDYHSIPLDQNSHIDSIYFGYNCPQKRIDTIRKILSYDTSIKYFVMQSDFKDIYNLIPVELK